MHSLDNPIWQALTTAQARLSEGDGIARRFQREVSILGACAEPTDKAFYSLAGLLKTGDRIGLFLEAPPQHLSALKITSAVPLLQMVHLKDQVEANGEQTHKLEIMQLGSSDVTDMLTLTALTKPGPFNKRTIEMGDYFGIRDGDKLVAMAGERLHFPGLTEISAVCTHPDHLGRGYARRLVLYLMRKIYDRGEKPCLHVRPENRRAVELYERLGFAKSKLSQYVILSR